MAELILHHYPISPFSHKIRAVLGYKQMAWRSVVTPMIMPKPELQTLTGGYRRVPVLQVGADVYCDSALICDVLEHLQPEPALYPEHVKGVSRILAQWADSSLYWAAMAYSFQERGRTVLFANAEPSEILAFMNDRKAMGMPQLRSRDAAGTYRSYIRRIASMVDENPFLLGKEPCIADFAAYTPLWFTRQATPELAHIFDATPSVLSWMDRIAQMGFGRHEKLSQFEAIGFAAQDEPVPLPANDVFQDDHGIPLGSRVTIAAESFGTEPTTGKLVAATRTRYTIARMDARAGLLHVHFPRIGYVLKLAEG